MARRSGIRGKPEGMTSGGPSSPHPSVSRITIIPFWAAMESSNAACRAGGAETKATLDVAVSFRP